MITKKDSSVFEKGNFLPNKFAKILKEIRKTSISNRLKRLEITQR